MISVIICSHNPNKETFSRVLRALKLQKLDYKLWELIVIDNASSVPISKMFEFKWHPRSQIFVEKNKGLTYARLKGIKEARYDLIVFVDDDNILSIDYLQHAMEIGLKYPFIGVFGGSCIPDFEKLPPASFKDLGILGLREYKRDYWSNDYDFKYAPIGAGMAIRKNIALAYSEMVENDRLRDSLGRKGNSLMSAEDLDMGYTALDMGYGYGVFCKLKLIHVIPSFRVKPEYLFELKKMTRLSKMVLSFIWFRRKPNKPVFSLRFLVGELFRFFSLSPMERASFRASRLAAKEFYSKFEENI